MSTWTDDLLNDLRKEKLKKENPEKDIINYEGGSIIVGKVRKPSNTGLSKEGQDAKNNGLKKV